MLAFRFGVYIIEVISSAPRAAKLEKKMKLPITSKQSSTGAYELFDAEGVKIGTIRTSQIGGSWEINKENASIIVGAVNSAFREVLNNKE